MKCDNNALQKHSRWIWSYCNQNTFHVQAFISVLSVSLYEIQYIFKKE